MTESLEEKEEKIYDFLVKNRGKLFSVNSLWEAIKKEYPDVYITYHMVNVVVRILEDRNELTLIDLGHSKVVRYVGKKELE